MRFIALVVMWSGLVFAPGAPPQDNAAFLPTFPVAARPSHLAYEAALRSVPTAESLLHWHELLCSEPHIAGTEADLRTSERIAEAFVAMGLEVEKHEVWAYLSRPVSATLEVVAPEHVALGIKEEPVAADQFSQRPDLHPGWNAYSGSGDVTAGIVYANYGTKADFQKLKDLGVDCAGKIVLARYGGNYRGYKAKFAEAAGAAGLIIFTDPADAGYCKGIMYPEGGYANDTCIQRGSLNTLDWDGDPLTPMEPATKDAKRVDAKTIDLPRIPVQPIGWGAAKEILSRMSGPGVPEGWQGGLPMAYRLVGGDALRVRLKVEQERFIARTVNVVATLRGSTYPDEKVILGSHHDAWGYGAADPMCGTITVIETARAFSELAKNGTGRPLRSVVFAAWAAEEYGLIGSVEWVETHRDDLFKNTVAYINLDMASMGLEFGAACSPSLRELVADAARAVPQPGGKDGQSVYDAWLARGKDPLAQSLPKTGDIGGGSDHVGFNCHLAVSAAGFGAGGSKGNSYHSNYDNLAWYWKVVGSDYESAKMVTRINCTAAARLACSPLIPLDPVRPAIDVRAYLASVSKDGIAAGMMHARDVAPSQAAPSKEKSDSRAGDPAIATELASLESAVITYGEHARRTWDRTLAAASSGRLSGPQLAGVNALALQLDRDWFIQKGLPGRPWFRSLLAATDEDSGYSSWMLPAFRRAVERKDPAEVATAENLYLAVFSRLTATLGRIDAILDAVPDTGTVPPNR